MGATVVGGVVVVVLVVGVAGAFVVGTGFDAVVDGDCYWTSFRTRR